MYRTYPCRHRGVSYSSPATTKYNGMELQWSGRDPSCNHIFFFFLACPRPSLLWECPRWLSIVTRRLRVTLLTRQTERNVSSSFARSFNVIIHRPSLFLLGLVCGGGGMLSGKSKSNVDYSQHVRVLFLLSVSPRTELLIPFHRRVATFLFLLGILDSIGCWGWIGSGK